MVRLVGKSLEISHFHVIYATAPLLIMQYAGNFNNFNLIYLFNKGGPPVSERMLEVQIS